MPLLERIRKALVCSVSSERLEDTQSDINMVTGRIYLLPLFLFVLLPATFCITYIIAVALNHVEADFPYISDTGTNSPESCIFGQLLNIAAALIAFTMYVRYKQVHTYYRYHLSGELIPRLNLISLFLGLIVALGVSMVANFQETNLLGVHLVGAMLSFGVGTAYIWIQTWLSYLVCPVINKKKMAHTRLAIAILCTIAFITGSVCAPLALSQFHGSNKRKWFPEDGGFKLHVVSTVSEWILAISFDLFILTYVREFQRITIATPQVYLNIEELRAPFLVDSIVNSPDEGSAEDGGGTERNEPPFRELLA